MFARRRTYAAAALALAVLLPAPAQAAPARVGGLDSSLVGGATKRADLGASAPGRVDVWVQPAAGGDAAAAARAVGATDVVDAGSVVEASVDRGRLAELAAYPGVRFVRPALTHQPTAVGDEGLAPTGALAWHEGGAAGAGARVAILDAGFAGLADSQAAGELPETTNLSHCKGGFEGTSHGTEVAEIVHAMAPDAQLTLVCAETLGQSLAALDELIARGVDIVNFSAGYIGYGPGDGTGGADLPDELPRRARQAGVLWVNAAGNSGNKHWEGTFADVPENGRVTRFTIPAGQQRCVRLRWADWPTSSQDYDVRIRDAAGTVVSTGGENAQTESKPDTPLEIACATNAGPAPATYEAEIVMYAATETPVLDLYADTAVSHGTAARSLIEPAASPDALTVGAVCWNGFGLESYSSQGPTRDGRVKPDLVAPANTSSDVYGPFSGCGVSGFTGTSVSAPHVTGAAALLLGARPHLDVAGLRAELTARALDLGAPGPDVAFGAGALHLGGLLPTDQRGPRALAPAPTSSEEPAPAPSEQTVAHAPQRAPRVVATKERSRGPRATDAIALPAAKRCVGTRRIKVRLKAFRDDLLRRVQVRRDGRLVASASGNARTYALTLKDLPRRGTYRVSVTATLASGQRLTLTRRYRACA